MKYMRLEMRQSDRAVSNMIRKGTKEKPRKRERKNSKENRSKKKEAKEKKS